MAETPKKKTRPGAGKGSDFERQVCRKLSGWLSNGKSEDLFWRTAMSGGRATLHLKRGVKSSAQAGDISMVKAEGAWLVERFVIECKTYKDLQIIHGIFDTKGLLSQFWATICKEAFVHGKLPILIAHENRTPTMFMTTTGGATMLGLGRLDRVATFPRWPAVVFKFDDVLLSPNPARYA